MEHKILLGLTTTPGSDWKEKVNEVDKFKIKELAFFPTFLNIKERKEIYNLIEKTKLEKIPHIHLRDDMEEWELDLFYNKYSTRLFNIHPNEAGYGFTAKSKFKNLIYVENLFDIEKMFYKILENCAGLCIDFAHWEDKGKILKNSGYEKMEAIIKKHKIGCCHISGISKEPRKEFNNREDEIVFYHDIHEISDLVQFDYIKKYLKYLPEYVSLELENPFKEQLKVKEYLEKIINR